MSSPTPDVARLMVTLGDALGTALRPASLTKELLTVEGLSVDDQYERALSATDELRHLLTDVWSTTAEADAFAFDWQARRGGLYHRAALLV